MFGDFHGDKTENTKAFFSFFFLGKFLKSREVSWRLGKY